MKRIRRRFRNWIMGYIGPVLVRLWMGSIRYRWCGPGIDCPAPRGEGNCIYVLWHQRLLAFIYTHRSQNARALISEHGDGEMISRIVERLGFKPIRGSSTRGGSRATRQLLQDVGAGFDYAIVPDGPRGPRFDFKPGSIFLASRMGLPLVPITVSFARFWQFRSWDGLIVPWPFTRALIRIAEEIHIPADISSEDLATWQRKLGDTLRDITTSSDTCFRELYHTAARYRRRTVRVRPTTTRPVG